jgi:hypothetical protein
MGILIIGSFWFWTLIVFSFILITVFIECDFALSATVTLIITFITLYLLVGDDFRSIVSSIIKNPIKLFTALFSYFLIGTIWSVVKWYFFLLKEKRKIIEKNDTYWRIPQVKEYKSNIMTWMTYWPFSMIWTLINDPIKRAFREIYEKISKFMQGMSDRIFKPLVDEKQNKANELKTNRTSGRHEELPR